MSQLVPAGSCARHPDRVANAQCDACKSPFCTSCRLRAVVVDGEFCSDKCRDRTEAARTHLLAGLEYPLATGWKLWVSSLSTVVQYVTPIAAGAAVVWQLNNAGLAALLALFSVALTRTILCQRYAALTRGNPYFWAARRFIPWVVTLSCALALMLASLGFVSFRLFWADEFSLIHRMGPIQSLRQSWYLTSGLSFDEMYVAQMFVEVPKLLAVGLVAFLAAVYPLPSMGPWGDGLTAFAMFLVAVVGYSALYAPEVARFFGMYVAQVRRELPGGY